MYCVAGTEDVVKAAISCGAGPEQDAAFAVMRACSDMPIFLNTIKGMGCAQSLSDLFKDKLSDKGLADLSWTVVQVCLFEERKKEL